MKLTHENLDGVLRTYNENKTTKIRFQDLITINENFPLYGMQS